MPLTAQSIIQRVAVTLNDQESVRWTVPELCRYFNDGQRDILVQRPDSRNLRVMHALTAGSRQTLPADGEKLIDINANSTGSRRSVTLIDRRLLDSQLPNWRSSTGSLEVYHYMYDWREPRTFEVYPPALLGASVDLEYSARPTDIPVPAEGTTFTAVTGTLDFPDLFGNAMANYILARCHSKDAAFAGGAQMAAAFYAAYINDLGQEARGTSTTQPSE